METDTHCDKVTGSLFVNAKVSSSELTMSIPEVDDLKAKVSFLESEVKELKRINKRRPAKWTSR